MFLIMNFLLVQFMIVMTKIGLAPFHYWIFVIVNGLEGWLLLWFLTFQKLPFFGVLILLFFEEIFVLLCVGFLFCYFQLFLIKDYKFILRISSTESFNWILLSYVFSVLNSLVLFLYYFFLSLFMIPFFVDKSGNDIEWLTLLVFINIPLGVAFFVKVFTLGQFLVCLNFWLLLVLFLMFMRFLSLRVWLIMKSLKRNVDNYYSRRWFYLFMACVFLLLA